MLFHWNFHLEILKKTASTCRIPTREVIIHTYLFKWCLLILIRILQARSQFFKNSDRNSFELLSREGYTLAKTENNNIPKKCGCSKGQLISKCPLGVIAWTKIPTKKLPRFLPKPLRRGQIKNFIKPIMLNNS